jgi:hypothetical protein
MAVWYIADVLFTNMTVYDIIKSRIEYFQKADLKQFRLVPRVVY